MADGLAIHVQQGHTAFRAKFWLACVAGIEKENTVYSLGKRFVCVAENDRIRTAAADAASIWSDNSRGLTIWWTRNFLSASVTTSVSL